jgi:hypothetical protein
MWISSQVLSFAAASSVRFDDSLLMRTTHMSQPLFVYSEHSNNDSTLTTARRIRHTDPGTGDVFIGLRDPVSSENAGVDLHSTASPWHSYIYMNVTSNSVVLAGAQFFTFINHFDYFVVGSSCLPIDADVDDESGVHHVCMEVSIPAGKTVEMDLSMLSSQSFTHQSMDLSSHKMDARCESLRDTIFNTGWYPDSVPFTVGSLQLSVEDYLFSYCGMADKVVRIQLLENETPDAVLGSRRNESNKCLVSRVSNLQQYVKARKDDDANNRQPPSLSLEQMHCMEDIYAVVSHDRNSVHDVGNTNLNFVYLSGWGMGHVGTRDQNSSSSKVDTLRYQQAERLYQSLRAYLDFYCVHSDCRLSNRLVVRSLFHVDSSFIRNTVGSASSTQIKALDSIIMPRDSEVLARAQSLLPFPTNISQAHVLLCVHDHHNEVSSAQATAYSWQQAHKRGFVHNPLRMSLFRVNPLLPLFRSCMLQFKEYMERIVSLRSQQLVVGLIGLDAINRFILSSCTHTVSHSRGLMLNVPCSDPNIQLPIVGGIFNLPTMLTFGAKLLLESAIEDIRDAVDVGAFAGVACNVFQYVDTVSAHSVVRHGDNVDDDSAVKKFAETVINAAIVGTEDNSLEGIHQVGIDFSQQLFILSGARHDNTRRNEQTYLKELQASAEEEFTLVDEEIEDIIERGADLIHSYLLHTHVHVGIVCSIDQYCLIYYYNRGFHFTEYGGLSGALVATQSSATAHTRSTYHHAHG